MQREEQEETAKSVPILIVDNEQNQIKLFKKACSHPKMSQHFHGISFKPLSIFHEPGVSIENLCKDIEVMLQQHNCWLVAMDRNLAGQINGEDVVAYYQTIFSHSQASFFAYTSDVGTEEHEKRWCNEDGTWMIQGFLPKSLLFHLGRPEYYNWVEKVTEAIETNPLMCQPFSGHEIMRLFEPSQIPPVTYSH